MWSTIVGMWVTISTLLDWICEFFLHIAANFNVVGRRIGGGAVVGLESNSALFDDEQYDCKASEITQVAPLHKYDVFINHRGPDVKLTFAAHLTDALCRAGFFPFLDAKSIRQGHHVFNSIDEALSGACVHVAIFSKGYAESKYCLQELCDMLQSQKIIIPVFYDVKPEHLRWIESGPYAYGFRKHRSRGRHKEIQKWKDALAQVSERRGFRKDEVNGDENELVKSIVVAVQRESPANLQPQRGHLFGLEESLEEVLDMLTMMKKNVGVLGLIGMGGIGKTTLATEIYNHYVSRREFTYHCFLKDVRSCEQLALQHQLVNDLIQEDMKSSTKKYRTWFDTFRTQKVLIIVDDVDNASQFEGLIPDILGLASGSRIVVTSRHKDVLISAVREAKRKDVYEVKVLNPMHSRQLFNWHAFYSEAPSRDFRDLAEKVADACGGHPLALEVIGASLFDKKDPGDREIWMDALQILNENGDILDKLRISYNTLPSDGDILDKLRISYNTLPSDGDKAMFRDIACLLIGMHVEVAMELWNSCRSCGDYCSTTKGPSLVLRRLVDKSLVKLDADCKLGMHDVIRDMGRDVVIKESSRPGKRTHLWNAATAARVLTKNEGTRRIRGIKLSTMESKSTPTYVAEQFASMDELHLLILDGCLVVGNDYSRLSQELRWVQWRSFPGADLPSGLDLPNLVVLDLSDSGNLSRLWQEDDLIQFPMLQRLILKNCRGLQELPPNIGQSMPRLRTMEMEKCSLIRVLPDSMGQLKYLEHLILFGCENLESLPDAVVNLAQLKRLMLDDCSKLKQLPVELGRLFNLEFLNLSNCKDLLELPPSVKGLRMLKELHMKSTCTLDGRLLPFVGALTALKVLHLCGNEMITILPRSFEDLKSLVHLEMTNCPAVLTVEALPKSLMYLDMAYCPQLTNFPSIAEVSSLKSLNLCNCKSLKQIGGLECLTALEEINLAGCTSMLQTESQVMHCKSLRTGYLSGSKVAVAYDNKWSEKEPAQQLISYYDDSIGYLPNGMTDKILAREWAHEFVAETTILSETECVAAIFCFVMHDQGWSSFSHDHGKYNSECYMDVWILRESTRVYQSRLFTLRHADGRNQVYLCTYRRRHPFVQSLKVGDKICVYGRSNFRGWKITMLEGAVCVVHGENEHRVIAMNSKLLNKTQSTDLVAKLSDLVLVDNTCSSLVSNSGDDETSMESDDTLASKDDSLAIYTENPYSPEQHGWIVEPEYGRYSWTYSWKLPRAGQGIISFVADGSNDINLAISERCQSVHPMYEVVIGGWQNTTTAIRRTRATMEVCRVAVGLTNPTAANRLWVSIDVTTSMIQVGRGDLGEDVIAIYRDSQFYSGVQYISFTTFDTPVTFSNVIITDMEEQTPVLDSYRLSEKVDQQVLNDAWAIVPVHGHYSWAQYWMLPKPGRGILSFTAEGSKDVHLAISGHPHTMDPMYEIIFGWLETSTMIRKKIGGESKYVVDTGVTSSVRQVWVSLDDRSGIIQVGQGEPGKNMYCIYKDPAFLLDAQYFSFTTIGTPVTYSNVAVTAILD